MSSALTQAPPKSQWLLQKAFLDDLAARYKTTAFIASDPIQIPHRFNDDPKACELVAFITAMMAYGRRDLIIAAVSNMLARMDNDPVAFVESFRPDRDGKAFKGFVYRFYKGPDLAFLIERLQAAYRHYGSLEAVFIENSGKNLKDSVDGFVGALLEGRSPAGYGQKFMFARPAGGGPCKRMNMVLRWLVRQDEPGGRVDFGLWQRALTPAELIIPLDTHVLQMNRQFGFSKRQTASWQMAEEITEALRRYCPEDPVRYDFALMGFSLDGTLPERFPFQALAANRV